MNIRLRRNERYFNPHPHTEDDFWIGGDKMIYCVISIHILTRRMTWSERSINDTIQISSSHGG